MNSEDHKSGAGPRVAIGHGRSPLWRELKDFVHDTLKLEWDEFNRESAAGLATTARLSKMLDEAGFAFLVMTAEDVHEDGKFHARENVIHEIGLFQGRLGFSKAIVLLEDGCEEFSNIHGLTQIRFPKGDIAARTEAIRRVLCREGFGSAECEQPNGALGAGHQAVQTLPPVEARPILFFLFDQGTGMTTDEIAEATNQQTSAVEYHCGELVNGGFVSRCKFRGDQRRLEGSDWGYGLTQKGRGWVIQQSRTGSA